MGKNSTDFPNDALKDTILMVIFSSSQIHNLNPTEEEI